MQKYLLWKSSSFLNIFILSGCSVEFSLWKRSYSRNNCCEKKTVLKKEEKSVALKRKLAQTDGGRNHKVMFVSYYLNKFLKLYVSQTKKCLSSRSNHQYSQEFINFAIFTGKQLRWSLFLIELQPSRLATVLKETPTKVFSCEYCDANW